MHRSIVVPSIVLVAAITAVFSQPAGGQIYRPPVHAPGARNPDGPADSFHAGGRWRLGVRGENTDIGVRVVDVLRGSAAESAGIEPGDVIVNVDGEQVGIVVGRLRPLDQYIDLKSDVQGRVDLLLWRTRGRQLQSVRVQLQAYRPPVQQPIPRPVVTGTVFCRERSILPRTSRLDVKLAEVGPNGAFIRTIGQFSQFGFKDPPVPFRINYDPATIDPRARYALSATISINGRVVYRSHNPYFVITRREPDHANIVVSSLR